MKITKSKLKKIIQEEYQRELAEGRPSVPDTDNFTFAGYDDGKIFAVMNCDPDEYQGECPSVQVASDGAIVYVDGNAFDAASAELDAALMAAIEAGSRPKGPPAGSMPMSQSPAYSDKEKERIKRRRIKAGYGDEYKE